MFDKSRKFYSHDFSFRHLVWWFDHKWSGPLRFPRGLLLSSFLGHTVTCPYTHCILSHEARTLVFMIIITDQFSILHKFVNNI